MRWPFVSRRERLRREASEWIAKLNGTHNHDDRTAFEQWYRSDPDHAATYDRLSALFSAAENIRPTSREGAVKKAPSRGAHGLRPRFALAALAAAGAAVILGYTVLGTRELLPSQDGVQVAGFAAQSESRLVTLVDGSEVLLSPGSELEVDFDDARRRLQLTHGEARFTVAHEARPFVVTAQGTEVVAKGTRFIVRLTPRETLVSLIEGRVEVTYPPSATGPRRVASLSPGQRLVVPAASTPGPATQPAAAGSPSVTTMIELDDTRLAEAVELMNRTSGREVRIADPALADLRVTGAFRAGDIDGFAEGVAAALSLDVRRDGDGALWLRARNDPRG